MALGRVEQPGLLSADSGLELFPRRDELRLAAHLCRQRDGGPAADCALFVGAALLGRGNQPERHEDVMHGYTPQAVLAPAGARQ